MGNMSTSQFSFDFKEEQSVNELIFDVVDDGVYHIVLMIYVFV